METQRRKRDLNGRTGVRFALIPACSILLLPIDSYPASAKTTPTVEASPKYTMLCASSATSCSPDDGLKIMLSLGTAAAAEASWADGNTLVSIAERDDPTQTLPADLIHLQETGTLGERRLSLHPVLAQANLRIDGYLNLLYRKHTPSIALQVFIKRPTRPDTHLPFTLELASAYKDGSLPLILSNSQVPRCVTRDERPTDCRIGSVLVLPIDNLAQWESATGRRASELVLYLNDVAMTGVIPLAGPVNELTQTPYSLRYVLDRDLATPSSANSWRALLATSEAAPITITVGLGVDSKHWIYPPGQTVALQIPRYFQLPWGIGALVLALTWALSRFTPSLRAYPAVPLSQAKFDATPTLSALAAIGVTPESLKPPHSLSMFFMALWTLLVSSCSFAMWGLTHSGDLINTTAISLLGIGVASFVFARAIDSPSPEDKTADQQLAQAINGFAPGNPASSAAVATAMSTARTARLITTGHWLSDVFSEKGSSRLDLHRLQVAAFTAFYFVVFLWSLNRLLALPDFSSSTLTLLGISNAGYLGFKFAAQPQ